MVACDAVVSGTCAYARVNTTDCRANPSRFGVSLRSEPRKPIRSVRIVSRVIRMTFGRMLVRGGVEVAAVRLDASQNTHSKRRIKGITRSSLSSPDQLGRGQEGRS